MLLLPANPASQQADESLQELLPMLLLPASNPARKQALFPFQESLPMVLLPPLAPVLLQALFPLQELSPIVTPSPSDKHESGDVQLFVPTTAAPESDVQYAPPGSHEPAPYVTAAEADCVELKSPAPNTTVRTANNMRNLGRACSM